MEKLLWFLQTSGMFEVAGHLSRPLLIAFLLYVSNYVIVLAIVTLRRGGFIGGRVDLAPTQGDALLVMPTLLGKKSELDGIKRAVESVLANGYPAPLLVCVAVDDSSRAPTLVRELEKWLTAQPTRGGVRLKVARLEKRGGKAMAVDAAVILVEQMVARGELRRFPRVFFNMDADSELAPGSLARMAARLNRAGRWSGERPMAVASNVCVRPAHSWKGWRAIFTIKGQLALQVAREYLTSISVARHNTRLLPVSSVSGALYATWSELYRAAPKYGAFVKALRWRDLARWWLGGGAPSFARSNVRPVPETMTGPGDDTWVAWLAMSARWRDGRLSLELPATPFHALVSAIRAWFVRPIAYDADAKIYTDTPVTIRALFKQRVRWNSSRVWLLGRFGLAPLFVWRLGAVVYIHVVAVVGLHAAILGGLILWPFVMRPTHWFALFVVGNALFMFVRTMATLLAIHQDGGRWHTLLALPLSGIYHVIFNVATTVIGLLEDLFGYGVNTGFAPEETLIRSGTGRVALGYRLVRAHKLAFRALLRGDVPFGAFWVGWSETRWTKDGYSGWTRR